MKAAVDLRLSDPSQPPQLHISRRAARCCTPPHGLIPTCGCVHVSVCLGAEELTSGSCYESSARISAVFFGHVVSDRMRSGQVLLTCATSPSLHLLGFFFPPLPFYSIVSTSTAWSRSINYVISPAAPSAILRPKKWLNSQDYVWKCVREDYEKRRGCTCTVYLVIDEEQIRLFRLLHEKRLCSRLYVWFS